MYIIWWPLNNILMLCFLYCIIGLCSQEEERLVRDLFRGYNKLIRPVQNMTQKVEVAFGLAFIQLINVNEKNQIMKSNVWLRLVSFIILWNRWKSSYTLHIWPWLWSWTSHLFYISLQKSCKVMLYLYFPRRYGMITSYSGMKPIMAVSVCSGYHQTKSGNQTSCYSTSNSFFFSLIK